MANVHGPVIDQTKTVRLKRLSLQHRKYFFMSHRSPSPRPGFVILVPKLLFGNALPRNSCFGQRSASAAPSSPGKAAKQEFRGDAFPNRSLGTRLDTRQFYERTGLTLLENQANSVAF